MDKVRKSVRAADAPTSGNAWAWLPAVMPGVAKLMQERRAQMGNAWCAECWRRGVLELQPGWFFAREGALAVGAPFDDPECANFAALQVSSSQALLMLRTPEAAHGQG